MVFETAATTETTLDRRIAAAVLTLLARSGVAKLTLDDVAREAGCSRATLYRYYPGKQAVLAAVVASESDRLRAGVKAALAEVATVGEALEAAARFGAREFAGHAALQFLLVHEPGSVLPHLCFAGADRLLALISEAVAPALGRFLPTLAARRVGEWLARIVLSYGCTPPADLPGVGGEAAVLQVVSDFVAPAVTLPGPGVSPRQEEDAHA
ncbi:MAG: TetR/AcrR family transcriptional regulator [Actinomycetota bacterium]|nr:TetR/AcrR family transcriptional regulator [Actinomycetota bacterium]